jgi:HSP20 family protein
MANITRYDPFGEMVTLRHAMDRLFEDSFVSPLTWRTLDGEMLSPAMDVHQTGDDIIVKAALPGLKPDDVEITITGQTLTIRGEFKANEKVSRDQYLYRERRYGTFNRQLQLPVRVQGDAATATFEDGLLTLRIPKAEEVKPRQIHDKPAAKPAQPTSGGNDKS